MEPLLTRFDEAAATLAAADVPRFGGRFKALDRAALSMQVLGQQVEHGVTILDAAGIDPESVRQVREAARMLGSKPLLERQVHGAARALTDAVGDVRSRNAALLGGVDALIQDAIRPAKDILASVDVVLTAEQRTALAAALRFGVDFGRIGTGQVHDRLVAAMPISTRVAVLRDMVGRPAGDLEPDELRLLGRMLEGRQLGKTGGVLAFHSDPPYSSSLDEAIDGAIVGTNPRRVLELDRFFARDVVTRMPEHERLTMATELFRKDVSELSPREWNMLEQLTAGEVSGYDTGLVTYIEGHEGLSRHIASRTMQGLPPSATMYAYFDANALKGVSNAERARIVEARFDAALDEAAAGSLSKAAQALLTASWPAAADRVSRMPIERQSAIAMTLLGLPKGPSGDLESVRTALHAIDRDLATMAVPKQFEDLHTQTRVLLDRNIGRMEGRHDPRAVRGYSIHPDYAEVGQIRSNGVLLRAVRDMATREAVATSATAERLTW